MMALKVSFDSSWFRTLIPIQPPQVEMPFRTTALLLTPFRQMQTLFFILALRILKLHPSTRTSPTYFQPPFLFLLISFRFWCLGNPEAVFTYHIKIKSLLYRDINIVVITRAHWICFSGGSDLRLLFKILKEEEEEETWMQRRGRFFVERDKTYNLTRADLYENFLLFLMSCKII